ncbi:isoleucine--tRNA ligase [Candidatus Uhrbacteria bacterium]|nr:isoleucine--tRNA ligase [Candidatus Uhrbacteria bacterium]MBD3284171.1 isoleucine--tRNA ligase [Candidatus Uhrbacteria bacterium]
MGFICVYHSTFVHLDPMPVSSHDACTSMPKPAKTESLKEERKSPFPAMEEEVLAYWDKKKIFERSVEERPEHKPFVFYDGPPFATGLPHYGHLLQSVIKDVVPRYQTMQGNRVVRRWGWDCHGLPVESLIEKEEGIKSRDELCAFGVQKFTDSCRTSVLRYVSEWKRYIERLGRWVDMDNAYKTLDQDYIESVWWVFAELVKKGYIYKDRRVSLYSPKRATPLANFEVAMDNAYVDHTDPAITVKFKVKDKERSYLLAWTTTPWTLVSNVALAVNPSLIYITVKLRDSGEFLTFAESRINEVLKQYYPLGISEDAENPDMPFEIVERHRGEELQGVKYEPLFTFYPVEVGHHVILAEYVSDEDGTGIVHIAPTYGEEDFQVGKAHRLTFVEALDDQGRFLPEVEPWAGEYYLHANPSIIEQLESRSLLYRNEKIQHSVAIDPRSKDLLIYRAQQAWFLNVTKLKPKLLETAKRIEWHPPHFKEGRFGKGLETSPDWNISRTRFWGAPIPVWECETCDERRIIGSMKELRTQATPDSFPADLDLHRPSIDHVKLTCEACGGVMRRVPEVFDCWFESGCMPYGAAHYPFEHREHFDQNFPADFVGEAQDQTRGWFRVLHIFATALLGKPAFKHVIVSGMVLNEDGKKMSKREKNYPDPWEILERYGADTLRLYMLSSPVVNGEQLNFSERELDEVSRKVLNLLWNVTKFYQTYANNERIELTKPRSAHVLDRWILARLHQVIQETTNAYDRYDLVGATRPIRTFIEDLSTWWLRRSRDRMRGEDVYERTDALKTLREVLLDFCAVMAPAAPFLAEKVYLEMEGLKSSVHLERWPKEDQRLIDLRLIEDMDWVREAVSVGLEQRAEAKMPIRQALASATLKLKDGSEVERIKHKPDLLELIRDELNVEAVQLAVGAAESVEVELDTELTPELIAKGMVRELIRHLMALRKQTGLTPQDEILIEIGVADKDLAAMVESQASEIRNGVRASDLRLMDAPDEKAKVITMGASTISLKIIQ